MTEKDLLKMYGAPPKTYHVEAPFTISSHNIYRDEILWKFMCSRTELYFYLRTWIIRGKMKYNDKLNLYQDYHKNGKLAASRSIGKLSKDLKQGPNRIRKDLKIMEYYGVIEIKTVEPKDAWDNRYHNIYIFGEHNKLKGKLNEEIYYIDIIL